MTPNLNVRNEIANNNGENVVFPLEGIQNLAEEDNGEEPQVIELHFRFPEMPHSTEVENNNDGVQSDNEVEACQQSSNASIEEHHSNHRNASLSQSQGRNTRRRLRRQQQRQRRHRRHRRQMHRNLKDMRKSLRKTLSTLERIESLMQTQINLIRIAR